MTRIDGRRLVAVLGLTLAAMLAAGTAVAETYFEKVENKVLVGSAFARLRGLTYEQCQERCLRESRCLAFEHYRGGGVIRRSSNCALFSSVREAKSSTWSDIAYKRQSVAAEGAAPVKKKAARSYSRRDDAEGAVAGSPVPGAGRASPPAEPRIRPAEAPQRSAEAPQPPAPPSAQSRPATRGLAPSASAPSSSAPAIARDVAPAGGAAPPGDRFHIVPVFYGTDRNQVKQAGRIGYANDRAKRLELGRALVSVPLDHKVPNIERPRAWTIPYIGTIQLEKEDPAKHFTVREIKVLTKQELLDQVKQRLNGSRSYRDQAIVFIHGYNTGFDAALYRTAQISYDLQFDGASFAYSWPAGGGLSRYLYDRDSAQGAERYLYEFLQMVQNETGAKSLNLIAHSMGNQMLVQVLRSLKLRAPDAVSRINQIILASPDIDRDAFEAIATEITGIARGITLYAAANDRALEASRIVAGNKPRAGDVPEGGPVIVKDIDTIDITNVSTAYLALNHSGYAESSELLTDIAFIFRHGTRPWEKRLSAYKPVTVPAGTYWRYDK